ncbi:hypothetical protein Tco_0647848 [Tanacetum coccineum]
MSFDIPASPEYVSGLAHASLAEQKHILFPEPFFFFLSLPTLLRIPSFLLRHPNSAIDDPKLPVYSYNIEDVRLLSAHVVKLRDMPELVLVLSGLSRLWVFTISFAFSSGPVLRFRRSLIMILDLLCRGFLFIVPPAAFDAAIPDPTLEDLAVGNPSAKVIAKAEASQKRKAFTYGATSSDVAKHTRSALAQSSGSTTRPNLFADNSGKESDYDNDDDACVEILLITPIRSATMTSISRNQGGDSTAEGPSTRGKGIMTDATIASFEGASHPWYLSGAAPSFRDISGDAIHRDFFPFSLGPYYATYPEGGVAGNCEFSREELKSLQERCAVFQGLKTQVSDFQKWFADLNDKLTSSDGAFMKAKAKGKERKKKIKSHTKNLDQLNAEVACLSAALNQAIALEAEKDEEILQLKASTSDFGELLSLAASAGFEGGLGMHQTQKGFDVVLKKISHQHPASRDSRVSPPMTMKSTVTPVSLSLELPSNIVPSSFAAVLERNEEWANAMVHGPNNEMTNGAGNGNPGNVLVQGVSCVVDDGAELTLVKSERVFSDPSDVVVALSVREKDDGLLPSSSAAEAAVAAPSGV